MSAEFSLDLRAPFRNGTTARRTLLDLVPRVERVDNYAGVEYSTQLEFVRKATDDTRQNQRELAVACKSIITSITPTNLIVSATDPDFLSDIIDEAGNILHSLGRNQTKADSIPKAIENIAKDVNTLKCNMDDTIKAKDGAIDLEIHASSDAVDRLSSQLDHVDTELSKLHQGQSKGAIGRIAHAASQWNWKRSNPSAAASTGSNEGSSVDVDEKIRNLEGKSADLREQLEASHERKSQARMQSDARTRAKATDPIGSTETAHMDVVAWGTESSNLLFVWNALAREITAYRQAFQAKKDKSSVENEKTLANKLKEVEVIVPQLKRLASALDDGVHNL